MTIDLWISVILAIPLAIIANLVTPKIGAWLSRRSETTRHRRSEKSKRRRTAQAAVLKKELERIRRFHSDRPRLVEYLLFVLIQIAAFGAVGSIYGGMLSFVGEFGGWDGFLGVIGRSGGQLAALFVSIYIFQVSMRAIRTRRRVQNFTDYERDTLAAISDLERE